MDGWIDVGILIWKPSDLKALLLFFSFLVIAVEAELFCRASSAEASNAVRIGMRTKACACCVIPLMVFPSLWAAAMQFRLYFVAS